MFRAECHPIIGWVLVKGLGQNLLTDIFLNLKERRRFQILVFAEDQLWAGATIVNEDGHAIGRAVKAGKGEAKGRYGVAWDELQIKGLLLRPLQIINSENFLLSQQDDKKILQENALKTVKMRTVKNKYIVIRTSFSKIICFLLKIMGYFWN